MGSVGGSKKSSQVVQAEEVVTPAVARSVEGDSESSLRKQEEARSRMRGIRSTYNRFNESADGGGDTSSKLG